MHVPVSQDHAPRIGQTSPNMFLNFSRQSITRSPSVDRATFANTFRPSTIPFVPTLSEPVPVPDTFPTYSQDDDAYAKLFEQVIDGARRKAGNFPPKERWTFDMHELSETLSENIEESSTIDMPFGKRSDGQMTHDQQIGAAGELYVCNFCFESVVLPINFNMKLGI
ncbi:hypothetical protein NHQ30_008887 [Ciborinia camelliae]|nr:hypothetical protein NHQ30_008887 [Ciborinia camelliae]